jgi:hypothetical protein
VAQNRERFRALVNLCVEEHSGYISCVYGNMLQSSFPVQFAMRMQGDHVHCFGGCFWITYQELLKGIWLLLCPCFFFSALFFTDQPSLFPTMRFCTKKKILHFCKFNVDFKIFNNRYRCSENMFFGSIFGFTRLEQRYTDLMLRLWLKKYKDMNNI